MRARDTSTLRAGHRRGQGHSKHLPGDGLDGFAAIFAVVFADFAGGLAGAADAAESYIADAATVLGHRDVAHVAQFVFDCPAGAGEREPPLGRRRHRFSARADCPSRRTDSGRS